MTKRQHVLSRLIHSHGLTIGAEIGVGTGPTTKYLMDHHSGLTWIGVDHFPHDYPLFPADRGLMGKERAAEVRGIYATVVGIYAPRLQWFDMPSLEAAARTKDGSLDLVFIDGDHSYEGCKADILAWLPKVRPGGWLTGHDYHIERYPGVVQAVKELVPGYATAEDFTWLAQVPA